MRCSPGNCKSYLHFHTKPLIKIYRRMYLVSLNLNSLFFSNLKKANLWSHKCTKVELYNKCWNLTIKNYIKSLEKGKRAQAPLPRSSFLERPSPKLASRWQPTNSIIRWNILYMDKQMSKVHKNVAKDCLLTLVKSRLALGSPGCLCGCSFVTMPKMAEYTENSCWLRPVQPITPQ